MPTKTEGNPTIARLREAALIVEKCAFDLAGIQSTTMVSELILISAQLDRLAEKAAQQTDEV